MIVGRVRFSGHKGEPLVAELNDDGVWSVPGDPGIQALLRLLAEIARAFYSPADGDPFEPLVREAADVLHGTFELTTVLDMMPDGILY